MGPKNVATVVKFVVTGLIELFPTSRINTPKTFPILIPSSSVPKRGCPQLLMRKSERCLYSSRLRPTSCVLKRVTRAPRIDKRAGISTAYRTVVAHVPRLPQTTRSRVTPQSACVPHRNPPTSTFQRRHLSQAVNSPKTALQTAGHSATTTCNAHCALCRAAFNPARTLYPPLTCAMSFRSGTTMATARNSCLRLSGKLDLIHQIWDGERRSRCGCLVVSGRRCSRSGGDVDRVGYFQCTFFR